MHHTRRLWLLVGIMAVVALGVTVTSLWMSYRTGVELERNRLISLVSSQANVLEAVARFDAQFSTDFPGGARSATLSQYREANLQFPGMGEAGEFTLAVRDGDWIRFLLRQRADARIEPDSVPWEGELAEPQRLALSGESGTILGRDYTGTRVLAAYQPVGIYGWGLVAKADIAEVRAPYIRSGLLVLLMATGLIGFGIVLFRRLGEPMIRDMDLSEMKYRVLTENIADGIWAMDSNLVFTYVNAAVEPILGYTPEEWVGTSLADHCPPDSLQRARDRLSSLADDPDSSVPFRVDIQLYRKDGTLVPVEVTGRPLVLPDGEVQIQGVTRSMEDRVTRERAVKEKAQELEALILASPVGIVQIDSQGMVTGWNPAANRIFGWTEQEMMGRTFPVGDWLRGEGRDDPMSQALEGTPITGLELAATGKGREKIDIRLSTAPTRDADGAIVGAMAIVEDVSEQRQAERAALEMQQRLEGFFYFSPALQHIKDLEGRHQEVNRRFEKVTGVTREEALGKTNEELFPPEVARFLSATDARVLDSGEPYSEEETIHWQGAERTFLTNKFPMFDADMDVVGLGSVAVEVTERKRAEEALRRSEAELRSLVDNAPYGILRTDSRGQFLSCNSTLTEILGYSSPDELLSVDAPSRIFSEDHQPADLIRRILDADEVGGQDVKWRRSGGEEILVRVRGRRVREDAEASSHRDDAPVLEMMVEDISERRRLEEQLRHAQKMEAVGQLTGGIAHDFNNELSVILLNAEMVKQDLEDGREIEVADLEQIHDAARRASNITRQLLGFSRRAELRLESTDLSDVVGRMGKLLKRVVREDIELEVSADGEVPATMVDPRAVEQILLNLTTNAQDAMPTGGRLSVTVESAELDEAYCQHHPEVEPGDFVCIEVRDTGTGMDEDTRARVFEPFFTTKTVGSGTGLGMAMVYGLTTQQGGHIQLYSEPREGTVVKLYFPVTEGPSGGSAVERTPSEVKGGAETVLVVEDEHAVRSAAKEALERMGYKVLTATNGKEAMALYEDHGHEVDLVLSDLVMPEIGGLALYEWLQARDPSIKFLLVSGYTGKKPGGTRQIDPAIPFVGKPWTLTELLNRVRELLDQD